MGTGSQWMKEEDEVLAHAWLATTEDSITGTGQKSSAFWKHVFEIWNGHLLPLHLIS